MNTPAIYHPSVRSLIGTTEVAYCQGRRGAAPYAGSCIRHSILDINPAIYTLAAAFVPGATHCAPRGAYNRRADKLNEETNLAGNGSTPQGTKPPTLSTTPEIRARGGTLPRGVSLHSTVPWP